MQGRRISAEIFIRSLPIQHHFHFMLLGKAHNEEGRNGWRHRNRHIVQGGDMVESIGDIIARRRIEKWLDVRVCAQYLTDPWSLVHLTFAFIVNAERFQGELWKILRYY